MDRFIFNQELRAKIDQNRAAFGYLQFWNICMIGKIKEVTAAAVLKRDLGRLDLRDNLLIPCKPQINECFQYQFEDLFLC